MTHWTKVNRKPSAASHLQTILVSLKWAAEEVQRRLKISLQFLISWSDDHQTCFATVNKKEVLTRFREVQSHAISSSGNSTNRAFFWNIKMEPELAMSGKIYYKAVSFAGRRNNHQLHLDYTKLKIFSYCSKNMTKQLRILCTIVKSLFV